MADGSVKIDVGLNLAKAEKDLAKLKEKIAKAEDALNADSSKKNAIEQQLGKAGAAADEAKRKVIELKQEIASTRSRDEKASLRAQLADATEEQRILTRESDRLNDEYVKVSSNIEKGEQNIAEMKQQAGELTREINAARPGEAIASGLEKAKKSFFRFLKYAIGIRSVYILFQRLKGAIKGAVQEFAEYDYQTKLALKTMEATKKAIRLTAGSALANIYQAILPIVQRIANWMLEAANAAAKFIAILSGKSSYKRAVVNTDEVAASLQETAEEEEDVADEADNIADSAKEAKKQLLGFDELNILDSDKETGTSGGKSGKSGKDKADAADLDGITMIEEAIDALDDSFLNRLALSVKDVLFDWSDLNPEQIAEKAIAGLAALLTGATGFMLGGVPGAIIGTLLGLTLGLVADSVIFDHDGVLSKDEIGTMIKDVLNMLVGGVIGFTLGGWKGALLGATLGFDLTLLEQALQTKFGEDGNNILSMIVDGLNYGLAAATGAKIGFTIGGPGGAAVGLVLGLAVTFLIDNILNGKEKLQEIDDYLTNVFAKDWEEVFGPVLTPIVDTFFSFLSAVWDNIKLLFSGLVDFITGVFTGDWELALNGVADVFEAAVNLMFGWFPWLLEEIQRIFTEITDFFENEVGPAIENFFGPIIGGHINECLDNILGWWADVKKVFDGVIDFIVGVFTAKWERAWRGVRGIFEGIFSTLADILKAPVNNIIRLVNKAIGALNKLIDGANKIPGVSIPRISEIPYLAKGGILKRGQIGFLEGSGAEAVVPLEKNTDWMRKVADSLMERMSQANFAAQLAEAYSTTPLPAMAGGGIVPPNAIQPSALTRDDMAQAVRQGVYDAIMALGGMPKSRGGLVMNVNGREFARATYEDRKAVDNEHGISMIVT